MNRIDTADRAARAFAPGSAGRSRRRRSLRTVAIALLALAAVTAPAIAAKRVWFQARGGLDLAHAAASAWSQDAALVYLENDDSIDPAGASSRWGYLFYSPSLDKARVYSVRSGKIVVAEDLGIKVEPPPVSAGWIDSDQALEIADREAGAEFRRQFDGKLQTMLLMRGAFEDGAPDETTWTVVYSASQAPNLFVVIDAAEGKVRRTWRG